MNISVTTQSPTELPVSGEYLFIRDAVGDIDVTFLTERGDFTVALGQGETIHRDFTGLRFQAKGSNQNISIRYGSGGYTPPITSIASTVVDQIRQPVEISGISSPVNIANLPTVQKVQVENLPQNQLVTIDNIPALQNVEVVNFPTPPDQQAVTLPDQDLLIGDYPVLAGESIEIQPRPGRSKLAIQITGAEKSLSRISNLGATVPSGLRLWGGGDLVGWLELATAQGLKIWCSADSDVSVVEFFE